MSALRTVIPSILPVALLAASGASLAADAGNGGWVQFGELRVEVLRAVALRADGDHPEDPGNVEVYLSRAPLDAAAMKASGYPEGAARDAVDAAGGGLVVVCITPQGAHCGTLIHHGEPAINERLSPHGELVLARDEPGHVAGRWTLAGFDLFGTAVAAEVHFDTPVHEAD
jgi:hypothetical protein